jgi:type I restriction enzyme S subunit
MLQREREARGDQCVPYLKALHVQQDVVAGIDDLPEMWASEWDTASIGIQVGDLLVCEGGQIGRSAFVPEGIPTNTVIEKSLHRVRSRGSNSLRYLHYVLEALRRSGWFEANSGTATLSHLTGEALSELRIPLPSVRRQHVIADYLDRETARIEALVEAKRRMVTLLDERWQVVMNDAAAGRLAATARRATSVPWLGDVPSHWREGHLKLMAQLGTGHTPSRSHPEWWVDLTIPWITTGEVAQMRSDRIEFITETRERISELGMSHSSATLHPAGTVVLCRTASAGYSAIMGRDMATSQDFVTWTCGPLLRPRFLLLCLRAMRQDLLGRLAMGSTHKTIYIPDIEAIKVPIPPLDEQDALVATAYSEQRTLDQWARRLATQIALLHERRQALITAAVTGDLDMPEAA